jgi:4-amino-4-deoxy-L-arabinose transferase-like glycosyltransferase
VLVARLTQRVTDSEIAARAAAVMLLGMLYFATFANAIMFDVLLATCALVALHGIVDLAEDRRRGVVLTGLGIGLGILAKGPVMLLDIGFAAVLAPWWNCGIARGNARYFGRLSIALLLGAAIALAWAIPAAIHGGPEYSHAIFLSQTFDRIQGVKTGTHAQPFWWYVVWLPVMLLPWPLVLRGRIDAMKALVRERGARLALAWVLPTVVAFSLIGGKQAHYLLPLLPGVALLFAVALDRGGFAVRVGLASIVLIAAGLVLAFLPGYAATRPNLALVSDTSPVWGALVAAIGVAMLVFSKRIQGALWPALAMVAVVLLFKLALIQGPGVRYDVRKIAAEVHAAQERGQPIAHLGWHHGVYEFAGRLTKPLPALTLAELPAWVAEHPDGLVISFYRRFRFRAEPIYTQPFRGVEVSIWNAKEALASGVDPNASHARDDGDDSSDED